MRKRHWKDRKNRKCPDCRKMITYTRKDNFDRAEFGVGQVHLVSGDPDGALICEQFQLVDDQMGVRRFRWPRPA